MADFVESICNHGLETIEAWHNTYLLCYANALKREGLPPDTKFAVFSDGNPVVPHLERAYRNWIESQREFASLGYVGLQLNMRHIPKKKRRKTK